MPPKNLALTTIAQFQSETDEIRSAPDSIATRLTVWILAALIATCAIVTFFVWIDRVVTSSSGKIVPTQAVDVFQALDPSIIKSIDVKEGEEVKAGQQLATLDKTFASADVDQLRLQIASLDAQIARAQAELDEKPLVFPAWQDAPHQHYAALQKALYDQRAAQNKAQIASNEEKIQQTEATIVRLQNDDERYMEREKISKQIEGMRATLVERQAGSLLNSLMATDSRVELSRTVESGRNNLLESKHLLASLHADADAFKQQWFATTSQELVTARNSLDTAQSQLSKATKHEDFVRLVAPESAIVLTLAKLSVGSVLKEGDSLMTLMRLRIPLEAEVNILSRDIGFLRPGDPATLKIDAFNFFEYGTAAGKVRWISEGSFTTDDDGKQTDAFYKVRISIDSVNFVNVPANFRLIPGMTLSADVNVGQRSLFRYILGGALHGAGEAMREP